MSYRVNNWLFRYKDKKLEVLIGRPKFTYRKHLLSIFLLVCISNYFKFVFVDFLKDDTFLANNPKMSFFITGIIISLPLVKPRKSRNFKHIYLGTMILYLQTFKK